MARWVTLRYKPHCEDRDFHFGEARHRSALPSAWAIRIAAIVVSERDVDCMAAHAALDPLLVLVVALQRAIEIVHRSALPRSV